MVVHSLDVNRDSFRSQDCEEALGPNLSAIGAPLHSTNSARLL